MREEYEFRVVDEFASRLFSADEGRRAAFIRIVRLQAGDPRIAKIGEVQRE
jgi:hypothetical protein